MKRKCETCGKNIITSKYGNERFCSSSCVGTKMIITGEGLPRKFNGYRSPHEYRFAQYLADLNIKFHYEGEGIPLKNEQEKDRHYVPDFYIPEKKVYVEIVTAGASKEKRHKILWFQEQYPNEKLVLITGKDIKNLIRKNLKIFY